MDPYERCLGETDVTRRIRALLDGAGVRYRWVEHGPTRTSEDSARARGEPLEVGGKSIVLRVDETFRVCVISAASRLNSNRVRKRYGQARARFATADELLERTGLVPGCVPPFGQPVLDLPNALDEGFLANDRIAFNAGSLCRSVVMGLEDYLQLAEPEIFPFAKPVDG
ncbi:MAG: YbaK/EbsC family protein [Planctomycetota bacterium]